VTGVASIRWVRPDFTTSANSSALAASEACSRLERGQQVRSPRLVGGEVHRGREHVVGGLPGVHVVVGVDELRAHLPAEDLGRAVGDDLVGVHVRARARPGLEHVDGEVLVELAVGDLLRGLRIASNCSSVRIPFSWFTTSPPRP
jgi:hypothetical protein